MKIVCSFTLLILLQANFALAVDLSPGTWSPTDRAELQQREFFLFPPYGGTVSGRTSLVAGTASPVAVHAGIVALRRGGTAADAAATVALRKSRLI